MGAIVVAAGGPAAMQTLVAAGGCSVAMEAFAVGRRLRSSSGGSCFLATTWEVVVSGAGSAAVETIIVASRCPVLFSNKRPKGCTPFPPHSYRQRPGVW